MQTPRVAVITLGCARNEVDSEELAGRMESAGFSLVEDAEDADAVVVNTCGFIEAAKRESVDVLLGSAGETAEGRRRAVVAVGCMAERYGQELASALPEADAVLGFDEYPSIAERLRDVLAGRPVVSHVPGDRRRLLPLAPAERGSAGGVHRPGHGEVAAAPGPAGAGPGPRETAVGVVAGWPGPTPGAPGWVRRRLTRGPVASVKIASGCDRRCAFCAIPSFRGAFVSRPQAEVEAEVGWLAAQGVREVVLVSENSTSYGKDLGDPRALERLVGALGRVEGLARVRVSYLQPAEVRPGLLDAMLGTPVVADHFDLSFQHASATLLRRMRRFGGAGSFLELIASIRSVAPTAGIRSNVIVGFPGETEADLVELVDFLQAAQLDAVGVFGYSDEEGTEAAGLPGKLDEVEIRSRVGHVLDVVEQVMAQRAEDRVGESVDVLVESTDGLVAEGRAEHQGPEDGCTLVRLPPDLRGRIAAGSILRSRVVSTEGVDLHAVEVSVVRI